MRVKPLVRRAGKAGWKVCLSRMSQKKTHLLPDGRSCGTRPGVADRDCDTAGAHSLQLGSHKQGNRLSRAALGASGYGCRRKSRKSLEWRDLRSQGHLFYSSCRFIEHFVIELEMTRHLEVCAHLRIFPGGHPNCNCESVRDDWVQSERRTARGRSPTHGRWYEFARRSHLLP